MAHEISQMKAFCRDAGDEELSRRLAELKEEHFRLRMTAATAALDNPKRIEMVRKHIARIKTEQRRRELEGADA